MGNDNRIDQIVPLPGFPPLVKNVPANYPMTPQPGKISLLFEYNKQNIWRKFSPYTEGDNIFGIFPNKQPFVWRYIDEKNKSLFGNLPNRFKSFESRALPIRSTTDDLVRVAKFSVSPQGIIFYAKQFGLQLLQPFDETRLYNPLSPILATLNPLTLGLIGKPTRHIELSLGGLLNAVGLSGLSAALSTSIIGSSKLSQEAQGQHKGILRGHTAGLAYSSLQTKWATSTGIGGFSMMSMMKNAAKSLFFSIVGIASPSNKYRADENTMELMYNNIREVSVRGGSSVLFSFFHPWFPGRHNNTNMPKMSPYPQSTWLGAVVPLFRFDTQNERNQGKINGKSVGYTTSGNGDKYGNYVGMAPDGEYTDSDMLVNYSRYLDERNNYLSKMTLPQDSAVKRVDQSLQKLLDGIRDAGYQVQLDANSRILSNPVSNVKGYDKIITATNSNGGVRGSLSEYKFTTKTLDVNGNRHPFTFKFASTNKTDGINRLPVLDQGRSVPKDVQSEIPGWEVWKPYEDDLIAFFFYDVVNERYIPFRATVKGLSETVTGNWDELRFIGRADQIYTYNGFVRTLSFSFNIVIGSIKEMFPTWNKINYMLGCLSPSSYTTAQGAVFNRFIVPPMFMLTIGDLYKYQPIIMKSLMLNIPDDAAWETLNEKNSDDWHYLNRTIQDASSRYKYAQLPREVEIQISCDLLEKERPVVGAAHFGHAIYEDIYGNQNERSAESEHNPRETEFDKSLIKYNDTMEPPREASTIGNRSRANRLPAGTDKVVEAKNSVPPVTSLPTSAGDIASKSRAVNSLSAGPNQLGTQGQAKANLGAKGVAALGQ